MHNTRMCRVRLGVSRCCAINSHTRNSGIDWLTNSTSVCESRFEKPGLQLEVSHPHLERGTNAASCSLRLLAQQICFVGQLPPRRPPGVPMPTEVAATLPAVSVPKTATISATLTLEKDGVTTSRSL
jgi:hypothetical protein